MQNLICISYYIFLCVYILAQSKSWRCNKAWNWINKSAAGYANIIIICTMQMFMVLLAFLTFHGVINQYLNNSFYKLLYTLWPTIIPINSKLDMEQFYCEFSSRLALINPFLICVWELLNLNKSWSVMVVLITCLFFYRSFSLKQTQKIYTENTYLIPFLCQIDNLNFHFSFFSDFTGK
jgi:hypothetical protein